MKIGSAVRTWIRAFALLVASGSFCLANAQTITVFALPTPSAEAIHIVSGPDGNLWFTETAGNKIGRITPGGVITEFALPTAAASPAGIAAGADGNLWFTETAAHKVGRITPTGVITEFALAGGSYPKGITAGPDGNLWFTATLPLGIGRITTAGAITEFATSSISVPEEIVVGPDGNLWFTEYWQAPGIGRMTPTGTYSHFSAPPFTAPVSIARGPDGALWFTNITDAIGRITTAGVITKFSTPPSNSSNGITTGPDGNIWITHESAVVTRMTEPGVFMQCAIPHPGRALVAGPDGNLWIAAWNQIIRFTLPVGNCPPLPPPPAPPLPSITVSPTPATSADVIHLTIDTMQFCYPAPDAVSVTRSGNVFEIRVPISNCLVGVPPPNYSFTVDVGPLAAGIYQVQFTLQIDGAPPRIQTLSFEVLVAANAKTLGSRATVSPSATLYGGFELASAATVYILVRGNSLGMLGVTPNFLDAPRVRIYNQQGQDIVTDQAGRPGFDTCLSSTPAAAAVVNYYQSIRGQPASGRDACIAQTLMLGAYTLSVTPSIPGVTTTSETSLPVSGEVLFEITLGP